MEVSRFQKGGSMKERSKDRRRKNASKASSGYGSASSGSDNDNNEPGAAAATLSPANFTGPAAIKVRLRPGEES